MADTSTHRYGLAAAASAKWLVVVLLACAAAMLLVELGRSAQAAAQAPPAVASCGKGVVLVAAQITPDSYGVYLVDADKGTMCVYQYQPTARKLRLLASRNFTYDLRLDDYNTQPSPREIRELVDQQGRLGEGGGQPQPTSQPLQE